MDCFDNDGCRLSMTTSPFTKSRSNVIPGMTWCRRTTSSVPSHHRCPASAIDRSAPALYPQHDVLTLTNVDLRTATWSSSTSGSPTTTALADSSTLLPIISLRNTPPFPDIIPVTPSLRCAPVILEYAAHTSPLLCTAITSCSYSFWMSVDHSMSSGVRKCMGGTSTLDITCPSGRMDTN